MGRSHDLLDADQRIDAAKAVIGGLVCEVDVHRPGVIDVGGCCASGAADQRIVAPPAQEFGECRITADHGVVEGGACDVIDVVELVDAAWDRRLARLEIDVHGAASGGIVKIIEPGAAVEGVAACAAGEDQIVIVAAINEIVAIAGIDRIVARAAVERIVAVSTRYRIVAVVAVHRVVAGAAIDRIVVEGGEDLGDVHQQIGAAGSVRSRTCAEIDIHSVWRAAVIGDAVHQRVIAARAVEKFVAGIADEAVVELGADDETDVDERVEAAGAVRGLAGREVDADRPRIAAVIGRAGPVRRIEHIVARSADKLGPRVSPGDEGVVAGAAVHDIIRSDRRIAAVDRVVSVAADFGVVSVAAVERHSGRAAGAEGVVTARAGVGVGDEFRNERVLDPAVTAVDVVPFAGVSEDLEIVLVKSVEVVRLAVVPIEVHAPGRTILPCPVAVGLGRIVELIATEPGVGSVHQAEHKIVLGLRLNAGKRPAERFGLGFGIDPSERPRIGHDENLRHIKPH